MLDSPIQIGDVLRLKPLYHETGSYAIVIHVHRADSPGDYGWISFDYVVMTEAGIIHHISEAVVEEIISTLL
ncbi:MAG: hypothetical protein CML56_01175 [Rhodobacteraceae bacterium]|nr:hypothetical protein [Paracoccaceae bacterium]